MPDVAVVVLAVAAWCGALFPQPVPWVWPLAGCLLALVLRQPLLLAAAVLVLASALSAAAWAGLAPPSPGRVAGAATLVRDPDQVRGAVRVDVRLGGRRYEAWARGTAASVLRARMAGEVVVVRGTVRGAPERARSWLSVRHVVGRLDLDDVRPWSAGSAASRSANAVRRTLVRGARPLGGESRAILLGVVLGDDRDQSPELTDAFRRSGLSHLLVVSGENVAFVLALAAPVLRRLGLRSRLVATFGVLLFFGMLTRWEPSVLRAGAMAALACTVATIGRPASRMRLLALAVTGLVLVDPLIVHAVGFQLSVGATVGIALLAGPLARRLPEVLAVTIAAQVGVAPVAIPLFGGLPPAALVANVLAVPVAAPLTAWGLTGGVLAGVAGPPFDAWLHLPTGLMARWLAGVARWAAGLSTPAVVALLVGGAAAWSVGSARWSWRSDRTASTSPPGPS